MAHIKPYFPQRLKYISHWISICSRSNVYIERIIVVAAAVAHAKVYQNFKKTFFCCTTSLCFKVKRKFEIEDQ